MYTPLQRNFDGSPLKQALRAQMQQNLTDHPESIEWASKSTFRAKRCIHVMGDEMFDAVMAHFSNAWFEARTWRTQAESYLNLLTRYQSYPHSTIAELVQAFGEPDL